MNKSTFYNPYRAGNPVLCISFLVVILALTFAVFYDYTNYIIYPAWILCLLGISLSSGTLLKNEKKFVIISLLFLLIDLFYCAIGYSTIVLGLLLRDINWIMAGVVSIYTMRFLQKREQNTAFFVIIISLLVCGLLLIRKGSVIIANEDQFDAASVASAWYGSLYMLLTGISLIFFIHVKKLIPRIIAVLVIVLCLYINIYILQRATNVIFTLAEIGLILIFLIKRKSIVVILTFIILFFVTYTSSSDAMINVIEWLAEISPSERLSVKLDQMSLALKYEDIASGGGSLAARNELIGVSWDTFTSSITHFVFGAGDHSDYNIIGDHSFFVDTLARYGIIGGIIIFVYYKKQFQIVMSYLDKKKDWSLYMQCAVIFVLYILRGFYGSFAQGLSNIFILVFFPLTIQIIHFYTNKSVQ